MIRSVLCVLLLLAACPAYAYADKYDFDKQHTQIIFMVSHEGFSRTFGRIKSFDGYFSFDEKEPEKSEVDVLLEPKSVDTSVPALDEALQGPRFFNVEKFPTMHFKSYQVHATGPNTGDVFGKLTMLGVTQLLTLHVTYNKSGVHPYTDNYVSGFSADATLKRSDYGMNAYLPDVGDDVTIHIEVEGTDPLKHPGNVQTPH